MPTYEVQYRLCQNWVRHSVQTGRDAALAAMNWLHNDYTSTRAINPVTGEVALTSNRY